MFLNKYALEKGFPGGLLTLEIHYMRTTKNLRRNKICPNKLTLQIILNIITVITTSKFRTPPIFQ